MEQLYIEALLINWHTGLKFSSENRNPQIPEIGRKNRSIHPKSWSPFTVLLSRCITVQLPELEKTPNCSPNIGSAVFTLQDLSKQGIIGSENQRCQVLDRVG